jgi:hypothetical protein
MSRHGEPVRSATPKPTDRAPPTPAAEKAARCPGPAAQLAAVHRTLAGGLAVQRREAILTAGQYARPSAGSGGHAAAGAVVQRQIIHKGIPLPAPTPGQKDMRSATVRHYDQQPERYVLKDTDSPEERKVHLLASPLRYLIGESHDVEGDTAGTSRWATTVAGWSSVTKVREGEHTSVSYGPEQLKDVVGTTSRNRNEKAYPQPASNIAKQPPLENIHEWLLGTLAASIEVLKDFSPGKIKNNMRFHKSRLKTDLGELVSFLSELSEEWYDDYILAYDALVALDEIKPDPLLDELYRFHTDFRDDYRQLILDMRLQAVLLLVVLERAQADYEVLADEFEDRKVHVEKIRAQSSVLVFLLSDFLNLSKVTKEEYQAIVDGLFPTTPKEKKRPANSDTSLKLTSPPRERAMISNLNRIPNEDCPVLVQIGDDHVGPVKEGMGARAEAVPEGQELDRVTEHKRPPR